MLFDFGEVKDGLQCMVVGVKVAIYLPGAYPGEISAAESACLYSLHSNVTACRRFSFAVTGADQDQPLHEQQTCTD
jgi:hypothetical protein